MPTIVSTTARQRIHLIANAHLDPVWLWNWEEGAAEALATFRSAAAICEENPNFVFNHNESLLYEWIDEYDPELSERIARLVESGQWQVMGGWFLQPDCNMPSGESFLRQIMVGRRYFHDKFGVAPKTAINFDPFGHSRGLVQILAKCGFENYLFCRPDPTFCDLPGSVFWWEGFDGSRVLARRTNGLYNSLMGRVLEHVEGVLERSASDLPDCVLWGVGNHGGGPSRQDLETLEDLRHTDETREFVHSTPDAYFDELRSADADYPLFSKEINRWAVGCYTSEIQIKQGHRALENEYFSTEKICVAAARMGMKYPTADLADALRDLLFAQFDDILPGSCVQSAEANSLRLIGHGREILSRLRARAVLTLARNEAPADPGTTAIFVFNPHPYILETEVDCEFQLADQNWSEKIIDVDVRQGSHRLPSQLAKEESNMPLDWRKRLIFRASLQPLALTRFDLKMEPIDATSCVKPHRLPQDWSFQTSHYNGRVDAGGRLCFGDQSAAELCQSLRLEVLDDAADSWASTDTRLGETIGEFTLLNPPEAAKFAGVRASELPPLQITEDGPVRTVVECLLGFERCRALVRYIIPKQGALIEVQITANWQSFDRALKLSLQPNFAIDALMTQTAFGGEPVPTDGSECVQQRYSMIRSADGQKELLCINDGVYGVDIRDGCLRSTLLRSPAYSAHDLGERHPPLNERFIPRIDQGLRTWRFWLAADGEGKLSEIADSLAASCNEKTFALPMNPGGKGQSAPSALRISNRSIILSALKMSEDGKAWIIRLFNPLSTAQSTSILLFGDAIQAEVSLNPCEVKTFACVRDGDAIREADILD